MHQLPYVKVNPKQARRFAQAVGKSARTDQIDAEMLARMGSALDLQAQEAPHESLHDLKQLLMARRGLSKDQTAAKPRLASVTVPLLQRQSKQRLRQIARDIAQIDAGLSQQAGKDDAMAERMDILVSIPGVGKLTAITMLVDMPDWDTRCQASRGARWLGPDHATIRQLAGCSAHKGAAAPGSDAHFTCPPSLRCASIAT